VRWRSTITSTASSVVSNVVTLVSSVVAMLLLSPLLTAISLAVTPAFVLFSRRVRRARRRARRDAQASVASIGSITLETLSVSGILLAKVFGRQAHEVDRYRVENANQAELQVRQAMVGRSFFAVTQFGRIFELIELRPRITEREDAVSLAPTEIRGEVALEQVSFRYGGGEDGGPTAPEEALRGASMLVAPGQLAASKAVGSGATLEIFQASD